MSSEFERYAKARQVALTSNKNESLRVLESKPKEKAKGTIVLIPGFGSLPSAWDKLLLKMKDEYNIFLIDTREKNTAVLEKNPDLTINRFSKDIGEVISTLKIQDYILVVSSMSGAYTLRALSLDLISPKISFLIGPVRRPEIPDWSWPIVWLAFPFLWKILIKPLTKFVIKYFYLDRSQKEQIKKYFGYLDNYDAKKIRKTLLTQKKFRITDEELSKIKSKCILIGAEKDKAHAAEITLGVHKAIKNSEYYDLKTNIDAHGLPLVELIEKILEK
ncbi:MAG: alpha/beta fold hydrolase [Candidatus Heimdallarchaeaceae archaeon]